jgi:hypothetical protein
LLGNDDSNISTLIDTTSSPWQWKNFAIDPDAIDLDTDNAKVVAGSWLALVSNQPEMGSADLPGYTELCRVSSVIHRSRTAFGLSGKITRVTPDTTENITGTRYPLRRTLVLAQSERLSVARTPLPQPVYGDLIALDRRSDGLEPDRAVAVTGTRQRVAFAPGNAGLSLVFGDGGSAVVAHGDEYFLAAPPDRLIGTTPIALAPDEFQSLIGRADITLRLPLVDAHGRTTTAVVKGHQIRLAGPHDDDPEIREIAFLAAQNGVTHTSDGTTLRLVDPLAHVYARGTARVNANVAAATHGETVEAILGSGDGSAANQRFALVQAPLTYVSANTPSGRTSTLQLRINDVRWSEVPTLFRAAPDARQYETSQNEDAITTIRFGDGVEGARLPSGESNLRVRYRKGLGAAGNVAAGKLTTLLSRPLGVGGATNPEAATGGEDAEPLDRARDNAPLTVLTLDRAVSIDDYANFARAFAGIDKAHALWIPAGPAQGVFLTIAGVDGAEVPDTSDTYAFLREALATYGDPLVPLRLSNFLDARFRCQLAVKVLADFTQDAVLAAVDEALRVHFSFPNRRFGQAVSVDEVAAVAHRVRGVEAAHVTRLYRVGTFVFFAPRLFATLPVASLTSAPTPAELLTLADDGLDVEVLP